MTVTFEDRTFTRLTQLPALEAGAAYVKCTFVGCRFSGARLDAQIFEDCVFSDCDLSLAGVAGTAFKNVLLERCKLQGVRFYECARWLLAVRFKECQLRFVSFADLPLKKTVFEDCELREASFVGTRLEEAVFARCDLTRAVFLRAHLEKADFTSAVGYSLDPEANFLRGARFSVYGLPGLLTKYGIETGELF